MHAKSWSKIVLLEYLVATLAILACLATCVTVKAVANSLVGQLAIDHITTSQGKNKIPFYKKQ